MTLSRSTIAFLLPAILVGLAACDRLGASGEVPAQSFANPLNSLGEDVGNLMGTILFPSEYSQRSVRFLLDERHFVTHPDGRFQIDWIPPGPHVLAIGVKGFEPIETRLSMPPDGEIVLKPLRLKLARGRVVGRLIYRDGKSASDVALLLRPLGGITVSDNDGIFQFIGVNAGEHVLQIADRGHRGEIPPFTLEPAEYRNLGLIRVDRLPSGRPAEFSFRENRP